jgi:dihydroflavonol-4-reductase
MKMGAPEFYIGVVDVRDLAEAQFNAGFSPQAEGRHIISAEETSFLDLSVILQKKYGSQYPFPKNTLPKFLVWLMAPLAGFKRRMISRNVGYHWLVDHSKSIKELGLKYRPVEESIVDFFQQMIDNDVFKKVKK